MKTLNRLLLATGVATLLGLSAGNAFAQERPGRGNFDPEAFRQRAMERYREQLEVKNDDEWKVVSTRIDKVLEARREVGFGGGFGRGGRGGGGGGGGGNGGAGAGGGASAGGGGGDQGGDRERRARFGGEPSPEAEALQKALESKASPDEIKAKLAKYREARKTKEAKLTAAQDELRKVLSVRQEAAAVMGGLLQ